MNVTKFSDFANSLVFSCVFVLICCHMDPSATEYLRFVSDNYLSYSKTFGNHEINAVVGASFEKSNTDFESVTGTGYDSDLLQTISAATLIAGSESLNYESSFVSFFGRINGYCT